MKNKALQKAFQGFLLAGTTLCSVFLALEITVRAHNAVTGKGLFSEPRNPLHNHAVQSLPFRTFGFPLYKDINGVRYIQSRHRELYTLQKPKGTFRIVCFGGSTTANYLQGVHYPHVLEELLRKRFNRTDIEVINTGYGAYSTPHFLILLALDVVHWQPDLVILSENINDLLAAYWPGFTFDYAHKYSDGYYQFDARQYYTTLNVLFQHSEAYWFLKDKLTRFTIATVEMAFPIRRKAFGKEPLAEAQRAFASNIASFVAIAQSKGIPVILATQPLQPDEGYFVRHMQTKPYNSKVVYPLHDEFVSHHQRYNDSIRAFANEAGVLLVDNDAIFRGEKRYFVDFVHYSKEGMKKLAENYADAISASGYIH